MLHLSARPKVDGSFGSKGKQPFYFTRREGQVMTIAGLWSAWTDKPVWDAGFPPQALPAITSARVRVFDGLPRPQHIRDHGW